jgi:hypothetical protein
VASDNCNCYSVRSDQILWQLIFEVEEIDSYCFLQMVCLPLAEHHWGQRGP